MPAAFYAFACSSSSAFHLPCVLSKTPLCYNVLMETTLDEIEHIKAILSQLPASALHEVRDFAAYLADRERRRKELIERVLKAEQNPDTVECTSPEEFIQAIERTETENDD